MGLIDTVGWLLNEESKNKLFPVNYSITIGDLLTAMILGDRNTHLIGGDIKIVADLLGLLEDKGAELFGSAVGLLGARAGAAATIFGAGVTGASGNVGLNIGGNTGITYFGPKIDIRRAPNLKATSSYKLTAPGWLVAGIITGLLVAFIISMELALYLKYGNPPKTGKNSDGTPWEPNTFQKVFQGVIPGIANRILGLLITYESKILYLYEAKLELQNAEKELKQAIEEYKETTEDIAKLIGMGFSNIAKESLTEANTKLADAYAKVTAAQAKVAAYDGKEVTK